MTFVNNPHTAAKIVAYYRVSTKRQGESGLGLEGPTTAVQAYAASGSGTIVAAYGEIESGKNNERPHLAKAIAHANRTKGRLVIAKLDRLARNVAFVANIMESGVDFAVATIPTPTGSPSTSWRQSRRMGSPH